jgi:hypothetical protein
MKLPKRQNPSKTNNVPRETIIFDNPLSKRVESSIIVYDRGFSYFYTNKEVHPMDGIKKYVIGLVGLLIALIGLRFLLNLGKKVPVVGKVAEVADNLASEGHL